jgi:hypothetical protein
MLRGPLAAVVLAILGVLLLFDTCSGKATGADYKTFGLILIGSAVLTVGYNALRRK